MASVTLNTRYRPARIGFCVRNNDLAAALLAIDFAHTLWGGRFCPIIPCDNAEYASRLVETFGIDALYAITNDDVIAEVISAHQHLAWPILDRDLYFGENGEKYPRFLSVTHPIRILAGRRTSITDYPTVLELEWEQEDTLAPWLCALVGRYPATDYSRRLGAEFKRLVPKSIKLRKDQDVPDGLLHQITPNSITAFDIQLGRRPTKGLYIGSGDRFFDVVTFWNLRATGKKMAFYEHVNDARLEKLLAKFQRFDTEQHAASDGDALPLYAKDKPCLEGPGLKSLTSPLLNIF